MIFLRFLKINKFAIFVKNTFQITKTLLVNLFIFQNKMIIFVAHNYIDFENGRTQQNLRGIYH